MMDFARARENMVEGQLRPNKITRADLLNRFNTVPRELFVDSQHRGVAYADSYVAMGGGRLMFPAMVSARLLQELALQPDDTVLVLAAGTGYTAMLLAPLVHTVTAVEENAGLLDLAKRAALSGKGANITWVTARPEKGCAKGAPYNKIIIDAGCEMLPDAVLEQLKPGGLLATVMYNEAGVGCATLFRKQGQKMVAHPLFETGCPTLTNFKKEQQFVF